MATVTIAVRRIYEDLKGPKSEYRVLVDRLWPRGVSKRSVRIDEWAKDLAPSTDLRRWYGHDPVRFAEFSHRYRDELREAVAVEAATAVLVEASSRSTLVLLTATKDVDHSGAVVLAKHLGRRRRR